MRDIALIFGGMLMGLGLHEAAHLAWREWQARKSRRNARGWFRRSEAPGRPAPAPAVPQPTPRRIRGQRPAHAAARPKQRRARFVGRVRRRKVPR